MLKLWCLEETLLQCDFNGFFVDKVMAIRYYLI